MSVPVKIIRERMLLTQDDFAKVLGLSRQMIWAYEKGRSMPRFETIKKLMEMARLNNIDIDAADFFVRE